jgi:hypothetical protein
MTRLSAATHIHTCPQWLEHKSGLCDTFRRLGVQRSLVILSCLFALDQVMHQKRPERPIAFGENRSWERTR